MIREIPLSTEQRLKELNNRKMKTLQECKDEIAKNNGYVNWSEFITIRGDSTLRIPELLNTLDSAAEIYASQYRSPSTPEKEFTRLQLKNAMMFANLTAVGPSAIDDYIGELQSLPSLKEPESKEEIIDYVCRRILQEAKVNFWKMKYDGMDSLKKQIKSEIL